MGGPVEAQKYVDDMTTVESIPRDATHYMDEAYEKKLFHATETENSIRKLKATCREKKPENKRGKNPAIGHFGE